MTQEELNGLPESHEQKAMYQPPDELMAVMDVNGCQWLLGYIDGVRVKRKMLACARES